MKTSIESHVKATLTPDEVRALVAEAVSREIGRPVSALDVRLVCDVNEEVEGVFEGATVNVIIPADRVETPDRRGPRFCGTKFSDPVARPVSDDSVRVAIDGRDYEVSYADRGDTAFVRPLDDQDAAIYRIRQTWEEDVALGEMSIWEGYACTCPDFRYRKAGGASACKHIEALGFHPDMLLPNDRPRPEAESDDLDGVDHADRMADYYAEGRADDARRFGSVSSTKDFGPVG